MLTQYDIFDLYLAIWHLHIHISQTQEHAVLHTLEMNIEIFNLLTDIFQNDQ